MTEPTITFAEPERKDQMATFGYGGKSVSCRIPGGATTEEAAEIMMEAINESDLECGATREGTTLIPTALKSGISTKEKLPMNEPTQPVDPVTAELRQQLAAAKAIKMTMPPGVRVRNVLRHEDEHSKQAMADAKQVAKKQALVAEIELAHARAENVRLGLQWWANRAMRRTAFSSSGKTASVMGRKRIMRMARQRQR